MDSDVTPEATPADSDTPSGADAPPATNAREIRQNLLRATVQILALENSGGSLQTMWTGSGTIISPDGLILTNAHVASDLDPRYQPDALGIAITVRSDDLPELQYLAEILAIDQALDLAVIKIVSDLGGDAIDNDRLNLNYVAVGDSDALDLGDLIQILGYPGIGGETITFTEGVVSGFTREPTVDGRAFVKTDATIAGGNSGGLAANLNGEIVGVPTQVGYGGAKRFADCRYLADTNNDGQINENDNCIPVGGFINAIRPVKLAKPLIEAARLGIVFTPSQGGATGVGTGEPSFDHLIFAPAVNDQDQPTTIVNQLPSGATDLYACWEYAGMADDMSWSAIWYRDDEELEDVSWPPALWKGGAAGSWWVSVYNEDGLTEGVYHLELYVEDALLLERSIQVGGSVSGPTFSHLIFADEVTDDDKAVNPSYLLPSGITQAYAFFDFSGMADGTTWSRVWYYEGEEIASKKAGWNEGETGSTWLSLYAESPLDPGDYRLELYVEDNMLSAANFTVAGSEAKDAIGPITFAAGKNDDGTPLNPGTLFPSGLLELRYFVDYHEMQDGMMFAARWLFDGEELLTFDLEWDRGAEGTFTDNIYRKTEEPLWDGDYTLELYLEGELVQTASATIGGGEAPPTPVPPPDDDGLQIQGYILDADTGYGIEGAIYIVLLPGVAIDDWDGEEADVYTTVTADSTGYFELPDLLQREEVYSIIVWSEGYGPVTGDDIAIGDEASPYEVEVMLQRE